MSKYFWLGLALVAALGFSTSQVLARGGHGGGHHGGEHHASHEHHADHDHGAHDAHRGNHYHHTNWAHHNRPFSRGWYGRHGRAWGYGWGGWGWGNPWAIGTFGAAAAWLGMENASPVVGNYGTVPTVYTSDTINTEPAEEQLNEYDNPTPGERQLAESDTDDEGATSDDLHLEMPTYSGDQDSPLDVTPEQAAQAEKLARSGAKDPPKDTAFLPLGVFSSAPQGKSEASALVHLAISKTGLVRGTYFDLLSDQDYPIRGALDKKTQQVAFTFGPQDKVVFETSLANLTQSQGAVAAHIENGQATKWIMARYEKEPADEDAADDNAATSEEPAEPAPQSDAAAE